MQQEAAASFSALCNLASFASNLGLPLSANELSQTGVSVLSALLEAGEIEGLDFQRRMENLDATLACAIHRSSVHTLFLSASNDFDLVASLIGPRLKSLVVYESDFGAEESRALRRALEQAGMLTSMRILRCRVLSGKKFVAAIHAAVSLQDLDMCTGELYDETPAEPVGGEMDRKTRLTVTCSDRCGGRLTAAAARLSSLESFIVEDCPLGDAGVAALAAGFQARWLCTLCLSNVEMGPAAAPALASLLHCTSRLCSLDISGNKIGSAASEAAKQIGDSVAKGCSKTLQELDISFCDLGPAGVTAFFSPLSGSIGALKSLVTLRVNDNDAGDVGTRAVSSCLLSAHTIRMKELSMSRNGISAEGAKHLAAALRSQQRNSSMMVLELRSNKIGPEAAAAVIGALISPWSSHPMETLSLPSCNLGDRGAEAVARLITAIGCQCIELDNNNIHSVGAKAIADVCDRPAARITLLDLSMNPIEEEGIECIAEKIVWKNRLVESLDLYGIKFSDKAAEALANAIEKRNRGGPLREVNMWSSNFSAIGRSVMDKVVKAEQGSGIGMRFNSWV